MTSFSELGEIKKMQLPSGKKNSKPETKKSSIEVEEREQVHPVEEQIKEIEANAQKQIEELKQEELRKKSAENAIVEKKRGRKAKPVRAEKDYLSVDIYGMREALKILCMREAKARNENEMPLGIYISELIKKDIEANKEYIDTVSKLI